MKRDGIIIATVAYGSDADRKLLKELATDENYFVETDEPETLRGFFIRSSSLAMAEGARIE